jgi:hypothetical protein
MRFIIAESLMHARNTAEIDCEWQPVSKSEWIDSDGEHVRYVSHAHDLHGRRGAVVYLGWNWQYNKEWRDGRFANIEQLMTLDVRRPQKAKET